MNLTLCMDMKGCPNRCKHCWIGHMNNKNLSDNDAKVIVDRFKDYFEKITVYSWLREPDYCENFRERWIADNELSSGNKPQRFELASFYKIVREPDYVKKVTLSELAIRYGNPNSTRLFEEDDYKMFLLNRYLVDK